MNGLETAPQTSLLVVDDHDLVRLGLRSLVQSHAQSSGQQIQVHEARSFEEAQALYRQHQDSIRLVLLDLHLPDAHGLSGLTRFKQDFPAAHIVVLSGETDPDFVRQAKARGASAYLTKSSDLQHVVDYIRALGLEPTHPDHDTNPYELEAPAASDVTAACVRIVRTASGESLKLTGRQAQMLDWILSGLSNRQIADMAHLSEGTVKNHVSSLLLMFGVRSRAQLISQLR